MFYRKYTFHTTLPGGYSAEQFLQDIVDKAQPKIFNRVIRTVDEYGLPVLTLQKRKRWQVEDEAVFRVSGSHLEVRYREFSALPILSVFLFPIAVSFVSMIQNPSNGNILRGTGFILFLSLIFLVAYAFRNLGFEYFKAWVNVMVETQGKPEERLTPAKA